VIPHPSSLTVFSKAESLRSSLKELEGLLEKYSPMMDEQTERVVDKVIKYGAIFAEVSSPIWVLHREASNVLTCSS